MENEGSVVERVLSDELHEDRPETRRSENGLNRATTRCSVFYFIFFPLSTSPFYLSSPSLSVECILNFH